MTIKDKVLKGGRIKLFHSDFPQESNKVFFVESGFDWEVNNYIVEHYMYLVNMFHDRGLEFQYLPVTTMGRNGNSYLLTYMKGYDKTVVKPGFVFWPYGKPYSQSGTEDSLSLLYRPLNINADLDKSFKLIIRKISFESQFGHYSDLDLDVCHYYGIPVILSDEEKEMIEKMKNVLQRMADKNSFPYSALVGELNGDPEWSIIVNKDNQIILKSARNEVEILAKNPLAKAFYILFLRHKEGISLSSLDDYLGEYKAIYRKIVGARRLNKQEIGRIEKLDANKASRIHEIKLAIDKVVYDSDVGLYIIDGDGYGGKKGIRIPNDFIKIESEDINEIPKTHPKIKKIIKLR